MTLRTNINSDSGDFSQFKVLNKTKPLALLGLCLASFMVIMELPMVFTILPTIKLSAAPTIAYLHWFMVIYILMIIIILIKIH